VVQRTPGHLRDKRDKRDGGARSYGQFCPLAAALDDVGDRWTLLIARELLFLGPRRFKDLSDALPGLAPNLLTTRLRSLEAAGLVERAQLPPPAGSSVYQLTAEGQGLRDPIVSLMRWGTTRMSPLAEAVEVRPELAMMAMRAAFVPAAAERLRTVYELTIDDLVLSLHVEDGTLRVSEGPAAAPSLRLRLPLRTFANIATGQLAVADVAATGGVEVEGTAQDIERFLQVFGLTEHRRSP
jgi:DNA-binding HxlR family transcriptional regulator/putative sterol carrier protein